MVLSFRTALDAPILRNRTVVATARAGPASTSTQSTASAPAGNDAPAGPRPHTKTAAESPSWISRASPLSKYATVFALRIVAPPTPASSICRQNTESFTKYSVVIDGSENPPIFGESEVLTLNHGNTNCSST